MLRKTRTILAALLIVFAATRANAQTLDQTYAFTGTCADCTGVGTGTLVVSGAPGQTSYTTPDFVSFSYGSNLIPALAITSADYFSADFASLPGPDDVVLFGDGEQLFTSASGYWCIGGACALDTGPAHLWAAAAAATPMPEPASIALLTPLILGLAAARLPWPTRPRRPR